MAKARSPDKRGLAKKDYLEGMKYKDIAKKYDVSLNTIKSWVKRYGWSKEKKQKGAHKKKKGAPLNNKNAVGHGAPSKNKNAEKHGFFSKYLPDETLSIVQEIKEKDPLDILWENIQIQYAAIIRAQKIMYVKDKEDTTKVIKKSKQYESELSQSSEIEYEFQMAWDKQANFLKAQSRAMSELRSMIKRYDEMLQSDLATEEQKLRIEKLKADIEKVRQDKGDKNIKVTIVDDIEGEADED
ncbi:phage terminase small subunit [Dethiothermospora halolimnae]|uniref:phage terminase small subunit n=1 Tax=Dethiothermospora halolimnae TaxID=3114390 RepID=UPI003CCC0D27